MNEQLFPMIAKTPLGQELLGSEGYTPKELYDYLNNYQKFGQIKPGATTATNNLKFRVQQQLENYVNQKFNFQTLTHQDWVVIDKEIGRKMKMRPSIFYKTYLSHNPTKETRMMFIATLLEGSGTFKQIFAQAK
jgi:hypothetical protein